MDEIFEACNDWKNKYTDEHRKRLEAEKRLHHWQDAVSHCSKDVFREIMAQSRAINADEKCGEPLEGGITTGAPECQHTYGTYMIQMPEGYSITSIEYTTNAYGTVHNAIMSNDGELCQRCGHTRILPFEAYCVGTHNHICHDCYIVLSIKERAEQLSKDSENADKRNVVP